MKSKVQAALIAFLLLASWLTVFRARAPYVGMTPTQYLGLAPVVINDFWISNKTCGASAQFSFNVSTSSTLVKGIFWNNSTNSNESVSLSDASGWTNFTQMLPSSNGTFAFQFWANDTNGYWATTGIRNMQVATRYNVWDAGQQGSYVYEYSAQAISNLENLTAYNNSPSGARWSSVDPYLRLVLDHGTVSNLEARIDSDVNAQDWADTVKLCVFTNKLNLTWANKQSDITNALGNFTMVGSLPYSGSGDTGNKSAFMPEDKWALYGYYWLSSIAVKRAR